MEPISDVVLSLALGAGAAAGTAAIDAMVKDAYEALKDLIKRRYPKVSIEPIEQAPASKARRAVVEEDLAAAGAGQDAELLRAAQKLIELVQKQAPATVQAIGVDLKDISASNLRLADIVATGTGVKVEKGTFSGDIDIRGVRAGLPPVDPKNG